MNWTVSSCASCQAEIIWCVSVKGSRMPVDARPAADGNLSLTENGTAAPRATVLAVAKRFGRTNLHKSHFATCQDADSWRKRGKA